MAKRVQNTGDVVLAEVPYDSNGMNVSHAQIRFGDGVAHVSLAKDDGEVLTPEVAVPVQEAPN